MDPQTIKASFERDGVVLLRGLIEPAALRRWQSAWAAYYRADRPVAFNPVSVDGPFPEALASLPRDPALLDAVQCVFGPDLALYNHRFVIKDQHSRKAVFLHQDTAYHYGGLDKASAFVALSDVGPDNGGLKFWLGTHRFGYLADAGELNEQVLREANGGADWPTLHPVMAPGDVALMHSATWHASPPHVAGCDRILADIIYCPASDPGGVELLRGQWRTELHLTPAMRARLFVRSRVSRLRELQQQVDQATRSAA